MVGCLLATAAMPAGVLAQDAAPPPPASTPATGATIFTPADFARFAPRNALDMLNQLPGFSINGDDDEVRGLGQANVNVLINGERLALKSESVSDRLAKVPASQVTRIEIVDGASLQIPGLSGQVANIITQSDGISGQFRWDTRFRPNYVKPRLWGGSVSVTGTTGAFEYTLGFENSGGTGATKGPTRITAPDGALIEDRWAHLAQASDYPKLSGSVKWDGPGSSVGNFTASYERGYFDLKDDEDRTRPDGDNRHRDYDARERSYEYEIGGDYEFAFGPGRLKLIGLERFEQQDYGEDFVLIPVDGSVSTGSRYRSLSEYGERIGRGEYGWAMLGGDWQLAGEAAFNRYRGNAHLFDLAPSGRFEEIPFPDGTGGVTEDRYDAVLTHSRQLASNLSFQIGVGGEISTLAQTGPQGLERTFQRPKGSASLAWTPHQGLDLSLKLARVVGQLSFGDFLAEVDLDAGNGSAGNVELVPTQSWEADFEIKQDLGRWGSSTLKLTANWYEDYIDWIPLPGGLETRGNVDRARLYGVDWINTFNLDPLGFKGAKLDLRINQDFPSIRDPLTGEKRVFSGWNDLYAEAALRHDIPGSDWAWGAGLEVYGHNPSYRLYETREDYEGPIYTNAFVENKDVFGLTVRASVFNLTDGRHIVHRVVYDGPRDSAPVRYYEDTDESVGPIFQFSVRGNF